MKKSIALASITGYLLTPLAALAQVSVDVKPPPVGISPATTVGTLLSNALTIVFVVAALAVLFMLIQGAFNWITSGGDKEKVGNARKAIIAALVGLALLAIAFVIVRVVGQVLNLDILNLRQLPTLQQCNDSNTVFDPATGGCVSRTDTPR